MAKRKEKKTGIPPTDPMLLAEFFLQDYAWAANPDDPKPEESACTLRRWREEWYIWREGRYERRRDDTLRQNVAAYLQNYCKDLFWSDGTRFSVTPNLLRAVIANIEPIVHIRETQDLNTWLDGQNRGQFLSVRNGLLRLGKILTKPLELQLKSHTPKYFTTVCLPYDFDSGAKCPEFEVFLGDIMLGRQDYIDLLQEFVGYLFRPDLREHKFLLCVGEGANGKTTFFDVVRALVGEQNCIETPISRFADRFALYGTIGKVVNIFSVIHRLCR